MKSRVLGSLVLAGAVTAGLTGCNLAAPQATKTLYDPSDGVSAELGDLLLRNILVLSNGEESNIVFTAVNNGDEARTLTIDYADALESVELDIDPSTVLALGTPGEDPIDLPGLSGELGSELDVTFSISGASDSTGVPVLTGELEEYSTIAPTPTAPVEDPTPVESDEDEASH